MLGSAQQAFGEKNTSGRNLYWSYAQSLCCRKSHTTQTHDAEKAIKIYKENITDKNIKPMVETVNAYLKALSGRRDYAAVAIDKFFLMVETGQVVNEETSHWALTACATSGSIKSAGEILKVLIW